MSRRRKDPERRWGNSQWYERNPDILGAINRALWELGWVWLPLKNEAERKKWIRQQELEAMLPPNYGAEATCCP